MRKISKLSVASLVLTLMASFLFFETLNFISGYGLSLLLHPLTLYYVIPLIIISLIASAAAIFNAYKKGEKAILAIISICLYFLFFVFIFTFVNVGFDGYYENAQVMGQRAILL